MNAAEKQLIGTWASDPGDSSGIEAYGRAKLQFGSDGTLTYTAREDDSDQIMALTFRVERPGVIITDQPSHPQIERTEYKFTTDGKLILELGGEKSTYVRVS
jgi:hypothetical protein